MFDPFPQQGELLRIQRLVGKDADIDIGIGGVVTAGAGPEKKKRKIVFPKKIN